MKNKTDKTKQPENLESIAEKIVSDESHKEKNKDLKSLKAEIKTAIGQYIQPIRYEEIYWKGEPNNDECLGRILFDGRVKLVCSETSLERLLDYCDIRNNLKGREIPLIEYVDSVFYPVRSGFLNRVEEDAKKLLKLAKKLKNVPKKYVPQPQTESVVRDREGYHFNSNTLKINEALFNPFLATRKRIYKTKFISRSKNVGGYIYNYVGRILSDKKVELICTESSLKDLVTYCDLVTSLKGKRIEVVEYLGLKEGYDKDFSLDKTEKDAKKLIELTKRLKDAPITYLSRL